jgi:4-hydroxy-3-polyprenylbenzoate decarboxylase
MGLDATSKWPGETQRAWGRSIVRDEAVERRMQALYDRLMHSKS